MSKKSRARGHGQTDRIRRRGLIGQWRKFVRWYLFSRDSFVQNGGDYKAMARRLDRDYRCPIYKHRPLQCVCLEKATRWHFEELGLVKIPTWQQGEARWLNGESREQERYRAFCARRDDRRKLLTARP